MNCAYCGKHFKPVGRQKYCQRNHAVYAGIQAERKREPEKHAFRAQRQNAFRRGIDFLFSFAEWIEWWGDDFTKRGRESGQLVMARKGDTGPYSPENVEKITCNQNMSDYHNS